MVSLWPCTRRKLLRSAAIVAPALILPSHRPLARTMHGSGGGGGGDYVAKAVNFDGLTWLVNQAPTITNPSVLSFSLWTTGIGVSSLLVRNNTYFFAEDTNGGFANNLGFTSEPYIFELITEDTPTPSNYAKWRWDTYTTPYIGWYNVLGAIDVNHSSGAKIIALYLNDVKVDPYFIDDGTPFALILSGVPFGIGGVPPSGGGSLLLGDMADLWIAPGQSLLDGEGLIPEATRRKFISALGKPVDLGSDGSTPTGSSPAIFMSGDADGFIVNRGTAGAFDYAVDSNVLTNATTSPSD